jgi:hypothetical protein
MTNEQVWQFHVVEGRQFDLNGKTYFAERAAQMADTLGCRVLQIKNVDLQNTAGGWMVTGTAVLENAKVHA